RLISWAPGRASPSAGWSCDPVANLRHDERTAPWVPPLAARIRIGQAALFVSQVEFDPRGVLRCVELRGEIEPETFALSPPSFATLEDLLEQRARHGDREPRPFVPIFGDDHDRGHGRECSHSSARLHRGAPIDREGPPTVSTCAEAPDLQ